MEIANLINHVEALIFASEKPLSSIELIELVNNAFGFMEDKVGIDQIETSIEGIREKYAAEFYPFELRQSGGGWQFLTKKEYHQTIAQLNGDKFLKRLSTAALETLAIIAYKQPITKSEIEAIRGVNCDYSIQKLLEKELIIISGRNEEMVGKPLIYATSRHFMDYFGINSSDELPQISEVLAEQVVTPTLVNADHFELEGEQQSPSVEEEIVSEDTAENTGDTISGDAESLTLAPKIEIEEVDIQSEEEDPTESDPTEGDPTDAETPSPEQD